MRETPVPFGDGFLCFHFGDKRIEGDTPSCDLGSSHFVKTISRLQLSKIVFMIGDFPQA
jgi:hypothetical protein